MPAEFSRTTKRKRITLPGGHAIDIPIVTSISFIDASDRYQETVYTIDNSSQAARITHIDTLHGTTQTGGADLTQSLQVERIDSWQVLDPSDRHQETQVSFDNRTGGDLQLPHFSTHLRTHYVTYRSADDASAFIITEYIDEFAVLDASDRYQETIYAVNNPPAGSYTLDPADADISDPGIIDPPWRTDPFQNIVAFSSNVDTGHPKDERYCVAINFHLDQGYGAFTDWETADVLAHLAPSQFVETWAVMGTVDFRSLPQVEAPDGSNAHYIGFTYKEWTNYFSLMGGPLPIEDYPHPYDMDYWHAGEFQASWDAFRADPTVVPRPVFITQWIPTLTVFDPITGHPRP